MNERPNKLMIAMLVIGMTSAVTGLWLNSKYHVIRIPAAAEDDCRFYYGAYALKAVEPVYSTDSSARSAGGPINRAGVHYVECVYQ